MEESTAREKVLKKVRDALIEKTDPPYPILDQDSPVFPELTEPLDLTFAKEFLKADGKFIYSESEDEFIGTLQSFILERNWSVLFCYDPLLAGLLHQGGIPYESEPARWEEMKVGITRCEYLVARTGSIVVSSRINPGRKIISFPDIHLVVATTSQLVPEMKDAFRKIRKKYPEHLPSLITLITGPSCTYAIEQTKVTGAHGPKEVYLFLIEDGISSDRK